MAHNYLPGMNPERQLRPSATRLEPAIWIREVMFLKEFTPEGILRRITLRRGLNIL
jgi:hypothetical protein